MAEHEAALRQQHEADAKKAMHAEAELLKLQVCSSDASSDGVQLTAAADRPAGERPRDGGGGGGREAGARGEAGGAGATVYPLFSYPVHGRMPREAE
jgi:hypothetical protein